MTIFGENFFRIFNLHRDIQAKQVSKSDIIKVSQTAEPANINKDSKKSENQICIGCPDSNSDRCKTCLTVKQIYV